MPYEVRAKAGQSAFSVVVETAREALKKIDELLDLALLWQIISFAAFYRIPESIFQ